MSNKLNWLDNFAEEQAKKLEKTASLNKKAEQVIVDPEEVPGVADGQEVTYKDKNYKVVDANYEDELGKGVVLEACLQATAGIEDEVPAEVPVEEPVADPMQMEMGGTPAPAVGVGDGKTPVSAPLAGGTKKLTDPPERAVQPYQGQEAYSIGDVRDQVEPQKFQAEEAETKSQIEQENSVDRTTPEGKYSPNRIINRMVGDVMNVPAEPVPTEVPVEEPVEEEIPAEEPANETPVETPVEEVPAEEEIPVEETPAEDLTEEVEEKPAEEVPADEDLTEEVEDEKEEDKKPVTSNRIMNRILSGK